jgi:hypothetical protein
MRTGIYAFAAMSSLVMATPGLADHFYAMQRPVGLRGGTTMTIHGEGPIHRGADGRYYCRHDDGTRGRVIGTFGGPRTAADGVRCQ